MSGKIPKAIKNKVIREWIQGLLRQRIARNNDIGEGTVTNIKMASNEEEYHDMELFRHLAIVLNENGLKPLDLAFADLTK